MSVSHVLLRLIADGLVVPIALIGAVIMLRTPPSERYHLMARAIMTGLIALFIASITSLFYQDGQRPFEQLGLSAGAAYLNNPGFPSDHSLLVFTITCVVWASTKNKKISATLLIMSILVAVGRVVALVHTPADVIGGFACAVIAALLIYGRGFFTHLYFCTK